MTGQTLLARVLSTPSADDLWQLHPYLLAIDDPEAVAAQEVARLFYCYLSCVAGKLASREHSSAAARLAAGSVGVIATQDVLEALASDRKRAIGNLLAGGLAATLETLGTFEHVKAWEREFASVHEEAVWHLYRLLWELSAETQPELSSERRRALLNDLLAPLRDPQREPAARAALLIRLLQFLLAIRLAGLLPALREQGVLQA